MTTTLDFISRTRSNLLGARQSNLNVLKTTIASAPDDGLAGYTVALDYPITGLASGTIISIGTHVFQAVSVNTTAQSFIGILVDHLAGATSPTAGALVRINPDYTDLDIMRALNDTINDMSAPLNGLFTTSTTVFAFNPAVASYAIDTTNLGLQDVLEVTYDEPGPERTWRIVPRNGYHVKRAAYTGDFPSGIMLTLTKGGYPGRNVRVVFSVPLLPITTWSAGTASTLDPLIEDIPVLGASARLLGPAEAKRNTTGSQSDTRRSSEVPPGANIGSARWFAAEYQRRIGAESARNASSWPYRRRTR